MAKELIIDDNFIMLPKVDFAFKRLFGNPKNIDLLKSLLNAILMVNEKNIIQPLSY